MVENHCNYISLNLEFKDIVDKAEVKYNDLKDKIKFNRNSNIEDPILVLKAEIETIKSPAAATKTKDVIPGKGRVSRREIPNCMKTPPKNGKLYKEPNIKTYHRYEVHG